MRVGREEIACAVAARCGIPVARNLERVFDRMPGTLIAEALLSGKIPAGQVIRVVAQGESLRFLPIKSSIDSHPVHG